MTFATPWAFAALLLLPILVYLEIHRQTRGRSSATILFSSTAHAAAAGRSWRQRLRHLPFGLRLLTVLLLIIGLARPQEGLEKIYDLNRGVAIEVVIDRSSSMGAEMEFDGRQLSRFEVVKQVVSEFINGNDGDLKGRPNDLIGIITFARYADTVCPLTLAHGAVEGFVTPMRMVSSRAEDGTAIGDGLALAAARLRTAEETLARQTAAEEQNSRDYEIKSKIIILLTDGEHNAGRRLPREAAALAKQWSIKIYTIGIGGDETISLPAFFGKQLMRTGRGVDEKTLKDLAESTGGIFRLAEDGDGLRAIYQEIDRLEKSEIESVRYMDYREFFVPFVLAGLALLVLEIVLRHTLLRKIP